MQAPAVQALAVQPPVIDHYTLRCVVMCSPTAVCPTTALSLDKEKKNNVSAVKVQSLNNQQS